MKIYYFSFGNHPNKSYLRLRTASYLWWGGGGGGGGDSTEEEYFSW